MNWRPLHSVSDLEAALPEIDELGIGTIGLPDEFLAWDLKDCEAFGLAAEAAGLTIAEVGYWNNLSTLDEELRSKRIDDVRSLLTRADIAGAGCVVTVVGSLESGQLAPHRDNFTDVGRDRARENVERVLDSMSLERTTYALEPWCNGFFHQAQDVSDFLRSIEHPLLRLHLDLMNMHSANTYFDSTAVVDAAFDLLAGDIVSVHAKDLLWDPKNMFLNLREVVPGDGVIDYSRFVTRLGELDPDMPVLTEHWPSIEDYHRGISFIRDRAHELRIEVRGRAI